MDTFESRKQFRAPDGRFPGYPLSSDDDKTIRCPFCGAPYKKIIPSFTAQLVCDYCGATFRTPPSMGVEVPRCENHPERYAVGKCNDCGGEFCNECLQTYDFDTRDGHALLYLCPDCLENRETNKSNSIIFAGILLFLAGFVAFDCCLADRNTLHRRGRWRYFDWSNEENQDESNNPAAEC